MYTVNTSVDFKGKIDHITFMQQPLTKPYNIGQPSLSFVDMLSTIGGTMDNLHSTDDGEPSEEFGFFIISGVEIV